MLTNCVPLMPTVQDKKHGIDVSNKIDSNTLLKNTKMQTNVISETLCSGSSVVEIDGTKVLCTVLGPIPALKNALNDTCIIECNLNSNAYIKDVLTSSESSISLSTNNTPPSSILESAMKPIICLHKYPKCIITINAVVLEVNMK